MSAITKYLSDYQPLDFVINSVYLTFDLSPNKTLVTNQMQVTTRSGYSGKICLDGEHLKLVSLKVDGAEISAENYVLTDSSLEFATPIGEFAVEIITEIDPENNTRLEGLYRSGGNYCSQCEPEGFRCITYFADRPDNLTLYTTKIIADKAENQVLLSNGNLLETGDLPDGKHYAIWQDPFLKPSYLFAVVAGNLSVLADSYQAADGREIKLEIYTDEKHLAKSRHAMDSLINSMRWDEERFGLIYDLDRYMIVSVDDFNMGAMENKGLNVFNSKYVLASAETATDTDFEGVEAVIAHEYFHNWTGNRVTCRDWFQLTLKEGLTVFRDQEFTADQLSPGVKRIEDVRRLRSHQFIEDAGPRSHPIQPQSYVEMNNFYTMTIYEKGAEVVRMYQTILGRDGFRKGMDLYFERHDGQAVTVADFRNAMADANQIDLSQMHNWYFQAGTPILKVSTKFVAEMNEFRIKASQSLPENSVNSKDFQPMVLPIKLGLYKQTGEQIQLDLTQVEQGAIRSENGSVVLLMTELEQEFVIKQISEQAVASVLQDFSAPVRLDYPQTIDELELLARFDADYFNRWEAINKLSLTEIKQNIARVQQGKPVELSAGFKAVQAGLIAEAKLPKADLSFLAYAMALPDMAYLIDEFSQQGELDLDALLAVYRQIPDLVGAEFEQDLTEIYQQLQTDKPYQYKTKDIGERAFKNRALSYLVATKSATAIEFAGEQYQQQAQMTDVYASLQNLAKIDSEQTEAALNDFYQKWQDEPLVLDKWFALQASSERGDVFARLEGLLNHEKFSYKNPNRVRSVIGVFANLNLANFHDISGKGYAWLAKQVLIIDKINPQISARMVIPLTEWRKFDKTRQDLMLAELKNISQQLESKDLAEIVNKSLPN